MKNAEEVHDAIQGSLEVDEIAVCWVITVEVAGTDGRRYIAHRAGGGDSGQDAPMAWTALGMLEAASSVAREQVVANTGEPPPEEGD